MGFFENKLFDGNEFYKKLYFLDERDLHEPSWQNVLTPLPLCEKLVNINTTFKKSGKTLILFNIHILRINFYLVGEEEFNNYYFIADSKEKYDMVVKQFPQIHITFLKENEWNVIELEKKIREFKVKNFDVVFSNPPYSKGAQCTKEEKNLDFTLLKMISKYSTYTSFVMTARFILDPNNENYRNEINDYVESIVLFDGNSNFGIKYHQPLCILTLNKNKKSGDIIIDDQIYLNKKYTIKNLNDFSKYGNLTDEEKQWWKEYFKDNEEFDSYAKHEVKYKKFKADMGFYINAAAGRNLLQDIVTVDQDDLHVFTDKTILKDSDKPESTKENDYHIVAINNKQEGIDINKSYKCEIIRAIIDYVKNSKRITKQTTSKLPWPVDENGNIKYFDNEDWIKKLNMPRTLANKIISYYNNHPELSIKK